VGEYRYCLDHECGRLGFTASNRLPSVRVQPRAPFLHSLGPVATVRHFKELPSPYVEGLGLSVARIDLFADFEGLDLQREDRRGFVCRGDESTTYESGAHVTGFNFGSRRSQRISARIYDKTTEMAAKGTDWWQVVWGDRHQPGATVWRIEFEIGRTALTELELHGPDAVLAAGPSLWRYCTNEWLTLPAPTSDSNRSRWSTDRRWVGVQSASLSQGATKLAWIRRHQRASSLRRLMPALVGYLVAFAVLAGTTDLGETLEALAVSVANDESARRMTFADRVRRRRMEGEYR
jgi:hypothetical protein